MLKLLKHTVEHVTDTLSPQDSEVLLDPMRRIAGETKEAALRELRGAPRQERSRLHGQQLETRRQFHAVHNITEPNSLDGLQVRGVWVSCSRS